jgi:hypothetical protein
MPTVMKRVLRHYRGLAVLQQPDAGYYFSGRYSAQGRTVAELVQDMASRGLRFGPAGDNHLRRSFGPRNLEDRNQNDGAKSADRTADPLTQRESAREVFTCFWGNERKDPEVDGVLCNSESQL